ncbi:MAG: alpha/beta fold hydrolase [Vampirovibrionales bacterium]|nr:alpha/beta fold hydrolase [Vampirovibrionales bacterium]
MTILTHFGMHNSNKSSPFAGTEANGLSSAAQPSEKQTPLPALETTQSLTHLPESARGVALLLHGFGGNVHEMRPVANLLIPLGWAVSAPLLPGHHRTPSQKMPASSWAEWVAVAKSHLEQLYQRYQQKVTLVALSNGSPIALELSQQHPEKIDKLVLIAPFFKIKMPEFFKFSGKKIVAALKYVMPHIKRGPSGILDPAERNKADALRHYKTLNSRALHSALELIERVKTNLHRVSHPLLMIVSSNDRVVCTDEAKQILAAMPSADKHLQEVHASNHILTLDHDKKEILERIADFLGLPVQQHNH